MSNIETLTCGICEQPFDRERKRGVKPSAGPCCSGGGMVSAMAVAAIRAYREFVRIDAWLHQSLALGELDRSEFLELKAENTMPDYDSLPDDETWKLATTLGLV